MKQHQKLFVLAALALALLLAGCWGSSKSTSLDVGTAPTPAKVGSEQCTNTCHAATVDVTGNPIAATWLANQEAHGGRVGCEDCHGGGGNHWGVGPIPFPNPPPSQCLACHSRDISPDAFNQTAHANPLPYPGSNGIFTGPGPDFFNAPFGDGSDNALSHGAPIFDVDSRGRKVAISKAQHAQECSVCHNASVRFEVDPRNKALLKPDPDNLPVPIVGCSSCHDAHQPDVRIATPTRTSPRAMFNFRNYMVDPVSFAQTPTPPNVPNPGVRLAGTIYMVNGAVQLSGTPDYSRVIGNNNEIYPERLCAACHTKGKYMFSAVDNAGVDISTTHQMDVFTQYSLSGHGDRFAAPFGEFTANPSFYGFDNGHRVSYPFDMSLPATGIPANTTRNAEGSFACMRCHHGIGSIAYQDNVEGTSSAAVLFGDVPVTCITCHDPHRNVAGQTKNTRKPLVFTKYSGTTPSNKTPKVTFSISGNVFLDNTPVPPETGDATICAFCHQGRESGLTLFKSRLFDNTYLDNNGFFNPHYLGTGAMLWARNGYEYPNRQYGMVVPHQQTNCFGCHMAAGKNGDGTDNGAIGGHTWKIVSDDDSVVNSATCNQVSCHRGQVPTTNSLGEFDDFRDTLLDPTNDYDGNGSPQGIAVEIAGLEDAVIALLDNNGITYSDISYPYFFIRGTTTQFKDWRLPTLKAAFNLSFVVKGLPAEATSQIGEPNPSAATHNYRYNIQLLHDSYEDLYNDLVARGLPIPAGLPAPSAMFRPTGTRPATNYANPGSTVYSPQQ